MPFFYYGQTIHNTLDIIVEMCHNLLRGEKIEMNDGLTEIVAISDKSGSMEPLTKDTIGGYNTFIKEQKAVPGEAILSTVLFSIGREKILHNRVNIKNVRSITELEYLTDDETALLGALGRAINHIGMVLNNTHEDEKPSKVIFFIIMAGEENASKQFSNDQIKQMVELQRNIYSWEFLFMGANIDAFSVAESMGIQRDRSFNYTAKLVENAQIAMSEAISNFRQYGNVYKGKDFRKKIK